MVKVLSSGESDSNECAEKKSVKKALYVWNKCQNIKIVNLLCIMHMSWNFLSIKFQLQTHVGVPGSSFVYHSMALYDLRVPLLRRLKKNANVCLIKTKVMLI